MGSADGNGRNKILISSPANQNIVTSNRRNNNSNHVSTIQRVICKLRAYIIFKGINSSLKKVDLTEKGINKPKSLDQFLNELLNNTN